MITSLEMYNTWFAGIQRAIADVETDRYVHKFSFDKLDLKPGSFFKARPATLAPWFKCRIITVEKEKEFGFDFQMTPFYSEYVSFVLEESKKGVFVTCNRFSKGPFSFLALLGWNKTKSKILQRLAEITPTIEIDDDDKGSDSLADSPELRAYNVAVVVNKALDGDMDPLNNTSDVITRGKAKAMLIKIKRGTAERPPIPDKVDSVASAPAAVKGAPSSTASNQLSKDDQVAVVVNQVLDGNTEAVDAIDDKVIRAKAKAMLVKIKRGSAERPAMPESSEPEPEAVVSDQKGESEDDMKERLIADGLNGNMEEINALENKVLRGKIKAAIVKAKRNK
jgi:hypothetical protein